MAKYNSLDCQVLLSENDFELRSYQDFFIIEYENEKDPNISLGFRTLFKYISSDNKENEKISMTTPVLTKSKSQVKKIAFVALDKDLNKIPNPNDPNLKIKLVKANLFATIKYSGYSSKDKEAVMIDKLKTWIALKNYDILSDFMYATYNAFFKPFFRRNEIWVMVSK